MIQFTRGLMRQPRWVVAWVGWLMVVNLLVPLFFLTHIEARVVLAVFAAAGMIMGFLTGRFGFTRLLGLGHFVWFPLLFWLWGRVGAVPPQEAFGLWLRILMATNALSLLLDVADVGRYLAGERGQVVDLS